MNNAVIWIVTPCGSSKNRRFGERIACIIRVTKIGEIRMLTATSNRTLLMEMTRSSGTSVLTKSARLLVTDNDCNSPILITLMLQVIRPSETSILTTATWRNIPEDGILQVNPVYTLKSYLFTINVNIIPTNAYSAHT
jgi:hypothetical protein